MGMKNTVSNPFFSVVIPAYNAEKYIGRCIDSVIAQSFESFEILCIDDGSTDNTPEILDEYMAADSRIQAIHIMNKGIANARNIGIELSRGKYIYFIDSDDWIESTLFENVYKKYSDNEVDIILFDYYLEYDSKNRCIKSNVLVEDEIDCKNSSYDSLSKYFFGGLRVVWNKFVLRHMIITNHIRFKELYHVEDVLYCLEIYSHAKRFEYFHFTGYHYYQGKTGISRKYIGEKVVKMHLELYAEQIKLESYFRGTDYHKIINTYLINALGVMLKRYIYNSLNSMKYAERGSYLEMLIGKPPFADAFKNYDNRYLGKRGKLFMIFGKPDLFILKTIGLIDAISSKIHYKNERAKN